MKGDQLCCCGGYGPFCALQNVVTVWFARWAPISCLQMECPWAFRCSRTVRWGALLNYSAFPVAQRPVQQARVTALHQAEPYALKSTTVADA
jgi:hypothetical protein